VGDRSQHPYCPDTYGHPAERHHLDHAQTCFHCERLWIKYPNGGQDKPNADTIQDFLTQRRITGPTDG